MLKSILPWFRGTTNTASAPPTPVVHTTPTQPVKHWGPVVNKAPPAKIKTNAPVKTNVHYATQTPNTSVTNYKPLPPPPPPGRIRAALEACSGRYDNAGQAVRAVQEALDQFSYRLGRYPEIEGWSGLVSYTVYNRRGVRRGIAIIAWDTIGPKDVSQPRLRQPYLVILKYVA